MTCLPLLFPQIVSLVDVCEMVNKAFPTNSSHRLLNCSIVGVFSYRFEIIISKYGTREIKEHPKTYDPKFRILKLDPPLNVWSNGVGWNVKSLAVRTSELRKIINLSVNKLRKKLQRRWLFLEIMCYHSLFQFAFGIFDLI
jgi:hypothetical protein